MTKSLAYINGKVLPSLDAKVSVMDRGFLFGDGIYEAGRSYRRCFLYLEEHWERFRRSAQKLAIEIPWSDDELRAGLFEVARSFGKDDMCFRTIVTRGPIDVVGLDVMGANTSTLVHVVQDIPIKFEVQHKKGIFLLTSKVQRNPVRSQDPNIKTSNYLNSLLALQDVKKRGGEDAILCDAKGTVTEGTNFSIFGITSQKEVITPSMEVGILDSITRRHVLKLACENFTVQEGAFSLRQFLGCKEAFIVSSTREVLPVRQWDTTEFPVSGPITAQLAQELKEDIRSYIDSHPKF